MVNSEDTNEMPQNVAFHLGLHCLLRQKLSSGRDIQYTIAILLLHYSYTPPDSRMKLLKLLKLKNMFVDENMVSTLFLPDILLDRPNPDQTTI